ncbi:MAG: Sec-independent protein translocase subunit TatA [Nocardioidaceae bacterium]
MGSLGPTEILLILLVLVLLFGAKKLPELARGSGRALRIFKAETKGLMEDEESTTDPHGRPLPPGTTTAPTTTTTSTGDTTGTTGTTPTGQAPTGSSVMPPASTAYPVVEPVNRDQQL